MWWSAEPPDRWPVENLGHAVDRVACAALNLIAMSLNLIKLCVGCDSVEDLEEWIAFRLDERRRAGEPAEHFHTTRMVPTRGAELIDGGSLYWVIKGSVQCRQLLTEIRPFIDDEGIGALPSDARPRGRAHRLAAAPRLPGLALPEAEGSAARSRQGPQGLRRDAAEAAAGTCRTRAALAVPREAGIMGSQVAIGRACKRPGTATSSHP